MCHVECDIGVSGWDAVRRITLDEPWQDFWVEVYLDPPMGIYIDMQKASSVALARPDEASMSALISSMRPLVAAHNLTDRDGAPLEPWVAANMGAKLIRSITAAITAAQNDEGGAPADPLPKTPASSSGRESPRSRSQRTTRSGGSRSG